MTPELVTSSQSTMDVCALYVTFHPDDGFAGRISSVKASVGKVLLVDNGSNSESLAMLRRLEDDPNVVLLPSDTNTGVAAAYNRGAAWARDHGFRWVVLLDQDTIPRADLVPILLSGYLRDTGHGRLGIVGSS